MTRKASRQVTRCIWIFIGSFFLTPPLLWFVLAGVKGRDYDSFPSDYLDFYWAVFPLSTEMVFPWICLFAPVVLYLLASGCHHCFIMLRGVLPFRRKLPPGARPEPTTNLPVRAEQSARRLWIGIAAVVVFLATVGLWRGVPGYRQYMALRELEREGAGFFAGRSDAPRWVKGAFDVIWLVDLDGASVTDDIFDHLIVLTSLNDIYISGTAITDAGVRRLRPSPHLSWLKLNQTGVTDATLMHLRDFSALQYLELQGTQVTDSGLSNLSRLTRLRFLAFGNTRVTDAGLEHLSGLTRLLALDLMNTPVTDAGLRHLKRLNSLQRLYLQGTQVTDEGVADLQRALPSLSIERTSSDLPRAPTPFHVLPLRRPWDSKL